MSLHSETEILDTTLREGEQCCGVFFPLEVKKRIAVLLDAIGVDFIEVGHPAAAPSIRKAVSEIAKLDPRPRLIAHARMDRDEIRLVRDLGVRWVGLFCAINGEGLRRYGLSRKDIFRKAADAVAYAQSIGLSVRFTCEDASRTKIHDLADFYALLASLGVERLGYADTLGVLAPHDVERLSCAAGDGVPFRKLHFHFHDDQGLASRNAITAIELGACCVDVTISGVGERAGLASLESIARFMSSRTNRPGYDTEAIEAAASLVKSCIDPVRFSKRRSAHKSGIHINGVMKHASAYETIDPGKSRIFVLSKLIGKSGLRMMLSRHGFKSSEETLLALLDRIKNEELLELAEPEAIIRYFLDHGLTKQTS